MMKFLEQKKLYSISISLKLWEVLHFRNCLQLAMNALAILLVQQCVSFCVSTFTSSVKLTYEYIFIFHESTNPIIPQLHWWLHY